MTEFSFFFLNRKTVNKGNNGYLLSCREMDYYIFMTLMSFLWMWSYSRTVNTEKQFFVSFKQSQTSCFPLFQCAAKLWEWLQLSHRTCLSLNSFSPIVSVIVSSCHHHLHRVIKSPAEKQLPKYMSHYNFFYALPSSLLGDVRVWPTVWESHQLPALHSPESKGK